MPEIPVKIDFDQMMTGASKVKLPGGVVGKICTVLIVISLSIAAIAWAAKSIWVSVLGMILVAAISSPLLFKLLNFADKHPEAAL